MRDSDRYLKIVEWSEADGVYVGTCPGLGLGGVHGKDERKVYRELCVVVDEWVAIFREDGKPLPPATAGWVTYNGDALRAFSVAMAAARGAPRRRPRARKAQAAKAARPSGGRGRARRATAAARA